MRRLLAALALPLLVALAPPASPSAICWSNATSGEVEVTADGHADATWYLDDRYLGYGQGVWAYQESNGWFFDKAPGVYADEFGQPVWIDLQRGGTGVLLHDPCVDRGPWAPDTLVG
jgi:hypothetical protein